MCTPLVTSRKLLPALAVDYSYTYDAFQAVDISNYQ